MKLFIFKAADVWAYCGGGLVVLAENFEGVKKVVEHEGIELFKTEREVEVKLEKEGWVCDVWVFVEALETNEKKARIVLCDYSYG